MKKLAWGSLQPQIQGKSMAAVTDLRYGFCSTTAHTYAFTSRTCDFYCVRDEIDRKIFLIDLKCSLLSPAFPFSPISSVHDQPLRSQVLDRPLNIFSPTRHLSYRSWRSFQPYNFQLCMTFRWISRVFKSNTGQHAAKMADSSTDGCIVQVRRYLGFVTHDRHVCHCITWPLSGPLWTPFCCLLPLGR